MQRKACHKFAESMGWEIVQEEQEAGVSGFKVSAADREAIIKLKEDALKNRFDILLVFMFDRLGRKEDETPFIVEWFASHGIEVWSVKTAETKRIEYPSGCMTIRNTMIKLEVHGMSKHFFDYDDGDFAMSISDSMAMDSDGSIMMRMGDHMAMDMDTGDIHMISSWPDDDE